VEKTYISSSSEDTYRTGEMIGKMLVPGDVVAVCGDLGAGKTVLVKGIAKGAGITADVVSPTYIFVNEYNGPADFFHFDMYRIKKAEEIYELGFYEYITPENICVIEWADRIEELLPPVRIKIMIDRDADKGSDHRKIRIITE
jgi:tRNA threonylcarbamoyladenosine biosynthesis protein TsaE